MPAETRAQIPSAAHSQKIAPQSPVVKNLSAREMFGSRGAMRAGPARRHASLVYAGSEQTHTPADLLVPVQTVADSDASQYPLAQREVDDRITAIERTIANLENGVQVSQEAGQPQRLYAPELSVAESDGGGNPAGEIVPTAIAAGGNLSLRLDAIERGLQVLTGRLEQVTRQQHQNSQKIETLTRALLALQNPAVAAGTAIQTPADGADPGETGSASDEAADEGYSSTDIAQSEDARAEDARAPAPLLAQQQPQPVTEVVGADEAYAAAYTALTNGDYARAETLFRSFLVLNGDDALAPEAQYNLGEVFLATGDNTAAADAFLTHVKNWPEDRRHIDAYIRLGTAFFRAGNKEQACGLLNSITERFPQISVRQRERLGVARQEAGC